MKHPFLLCIAALASLSMLSSCAAVIFGSSDNASNNTSESASDDSTASAEATETTDNSSTSEEPQEPAVDCDAFMQQLASTCYAVTAFEADGTTPLHIKDENGNDMGEVDQNWAADYCECYAQLAFQTFGCTTVISHEKLDDDAYALTYQSIVSACSNPINNDSSSDNASQSDAAPADSNNAAATNVN